MVDESFMLISLKEEQSKDLAHVIGNKTARSILDFLANKEHSTESKMAKELNIPLSTVHYNCKALIKSGLVIADEYHYSEKGKEVPHYKLAKKYIIIAPKEESRESVMERLKKFLPLGALAIGGAFIIQAFQSLQTKSLGASRSFAANMDMVAEEAAPRVMAVAQNASTGVADAVAKGVEAAPMMAADMAQEAVNATPVVIQQASSWSPSPLALGFLIGGLVLVAAYVFHDFLKKK